MRAFIRILFENFAEEVKLSELTLRNPQIFTGFSHLGNCQEFVWFPPTERLVGKKLPSKFYIKGLQCQNDLEGLMLRNDLFLHTPSGEEYLVSNFQITDISDLKNIKGFATDCYPLLEGFPEAKSASIGQKIKIIKDTHLHAFRAITAIIGSVHSKKQVDIRLAREVAYKLASDIVSNPDAVLNLIAIKNFDDYTFSHNINVATISMMIAQALSLSPDEIQTLGTGALLHDLGRLRISQHILSKEGQLTRLEFSEIAKHPAIGINLAGSSKSLDPNIATVILHHHERFKGGGYPHGQKGDRISLAARICSVADVFDALTTDRPFRKALSPYKAMSLMLGQVRTQFDPEIFQVFLRQVSLYPVGTIVELNTGQQAVVVKANARSLVQPTVKLIEGTPGPEQVINLANTPGYFILRALLEVR